ncbi:peroxidasin homolog [Corticium candelabrum]|uniref:peroxidasin homolog n=1 Tax=Corticium candelabrum TaxID=121492 RepID=UPI002E274A65|nr:peroxidasin homolog [Corticium candelabrum]
MTVSSILATVTVAVILHTSTAQCPTGCTCLGTVINCRTSSLTSIPNFGDIAKTAQSLSLGDNQIASLDENAFSTLISLQQLFLDSNSITSVSENAFAGLGNVTDLRLNENKLKTLARDVFQPLTSLKTLHLQDNVLTTLPDNIFANLDLTTIKLENNRLSCDCTTRWLGEWIRNNSAVVDTPDNILCNFPPSLANQPISNVLTSKFVCEAPTLNGSPSNETIRTTERLTLLCNVSSIPRSDFTWSRDGVVVEADDRVTVDESGSLVVSSVELTDAGVYVCNASNLEGFVVSLSATVTVEESTCFDHLFTADHESDVDCGGPHCKPCNETQNCLSDRDCQDKLYCMGVHELLSGLLYIGQRHVLYGTCVNETKPSTTLAERFRTALIGRDDPLPDIDAAADLQTINDRLHDELATQLNAKKEVIKNVNVVSVERYGNPLLQIYFELDRVVDREAADSARRQLETNMHEGKILGTLSLKDDSDTILITL